MTKFYRDRRVIRSSNFVYGVKGRILWNIFFHVIALIILAACTTLIAGIYLGNLMLNKIKDIFEEYTYYTVYYTLSEYILFPLLSNFFIAPVLCVLVFFVLALFIDSLTLLKNHNVFFEEEYFLICGKVLFYIDLVSVEKKKTRILKKRYWKICGLPRNSGQLHEFLIVSTADSDVKFNQVLNNLGEEDLV